MVKLTWYFLNGKLLMYSTNDIDPLKHSTVIVIKLFGYHDGITIECFKS